MKKNEHLPFHVIVSASEGDKQAIQKVLKHYDGYISKQCLRPLYDEYGQVHMVVDSGNERENTKCRYENGTAI